MDVIINFKFLLQKVRKLLVNGAAVDLSDAQFVGLGKPQNVCLFPFK